jgi:Fe-only nitrogenase accessory protein AnfO
MKIAVFMDNKGETLPFGEVGTVELYDRDADGWYCTNCVPFRPNRTMNLHLLRQCIYKTASQLEGCKVFVVKKTQGIFKAIFEEELGMNVRTFDGSPLESLDQIREQREQEIIAGAALPVCDRSCRRDEATGIQPAPVGNADRELYRINLVEVQKKNTSLNSKEILLPFLKEGNFHELEIICIHPPKWIGEALQTLRIEMRNEERNDGFCHVFVYPFRD